jgi:diaminopimelate decarboxylase
MVPIDMSLLPRTAELTSPGRLIVGGVDLLDIAAKYGTPAFVYDVQHLRSNFEAAINVFGPGVAYATKAFLCKALAALAYDCGMSLDVSTGGEYHVCREAGVPSSKLVVHGNNKTRAEVERAVTEGVQWIVLDSFDDIALVIAVAESERRRVPVLIRVNPGVEVHTHRFNATGNRVSKFGFPMWTGDAERALGEVLRSNALDLKGIHIHVGSLVFTIDTFLAALDSVTDLVCSAEPEYFVVGGGLGVRYLTTDTAPTFEEWGGSILKRCSEAGVKARVLAEPGRSMVAATALTLYGVGSVVTKGAQTYVAVDGGMSDNPRPLLYDSGYEVMSVTQPLADQEAPVTIVGRHCESGDTLVQDGMLPASIKIGDIISTPVTGAYGYCMASNYNQMPRPAVVWVEGGQDRQVIRRETFEDLLSCDVWLSP